MTIYRLPWAVVFMIGVITSSVVITAVAVRSIDKKLSEPITVKRYDPPEDPHALEKIEAEKKEALKPAPLPPCPLTDLGHGS